MKGRERMCVFVCVCEGENERSVREREREEGKKKRIVCAYVLRALILFDHSWAWNPPPPTPHRSVRLFVKLFE